ncbi:MAG: hypothetical protein BroJett018_10960 [Chloroflexota bacterium]|nr:hypothetical protein [Chloroflexota bacterium]NOG64827.1 hypothetical protein [Chloroflexota bacterium]GIK63302.1 MAG: hypothetical protein BroJett018_10960 [Chloroflexota bacterium]
MDRKFIYPTSHQKRTHIWLTLLLLALASIIAACDTLDRIGERPDPTQTSVVFRTATPGGRISVWLVSPTGQAIAQVGTPNPNNPGEIIGPVGTATAIVQTLVAATQTALAPASAPNFQSNNCPQPSGRVPEPRPLSFAEFPAAIGTYLSDGGPTAVMESELRNWGAITGAGGVVQANTDLTGDGVEEVLITLFNPFTYNPDSPLNSGQLLVYGCDNGGYRLLYSTPNSPGLALPILHRVGDMNGDVKAELVYDIQSCGQTYCTREGQILTWNPITGAFEPLNNAPIVAINGRLGVLDIDGDGILELTARSNPLSDSASGPTRAQIDVWDWTGKNYILAVRNADEPRYRIHALHDADAAFGVSSWRTAITNYSRVRDDETLLAWTLPSEREMLRAYAAYKMVITYARLRENARAESILAVLVAENPEGTPGAGYSSMGLAFMNDFRASNNLTTACQVTLGVANGRPEVVTFLNNYGYANRVYAVTELCPF